MSNKLRHWKQRWNPDAEFVFMKRLTLRLPGLESVQPGDPVPKDKLSLHRLRRWWEAGVIQLADFLPKPRPESVASLRRVDNDRWELRIPGQQPRMLGDAADGRRLLAEWEASQKPVVKTESAPHLVQVSAQVWELHAAGREPQRVFGRRKAEDALAAAQAEVCGQSS